MVFDVNETYHIVSAVAYLIGVRKEFFENEEGIFEIESYNRFNEIKEARMIRSLCKIRTSLLLNYAKIEPEMIYNMKNLESLPYFSAPDIKQLREFGLDIVKANYKPDKYMIDINRYIQSRIDQCRELFPMWVNWAYLRDLFIMPSGFKDKTIIAERAKFTNNLNAYPYRAISTGNRV